MEQVLSDREMICAARKMDPAGLTLIYQTYSPGIHRYAARLLGNADQAEDCVAETFSRFLKAVSQGQGPSNHLQAYLYRIAHNWVTDSFRRQAPVDSGLDESILAERENQPEDEISVRLEAERVRLAIRSLTPEQRQVVVLRVYEEWTYEEISYALGKPEGNIRALFFRAIQSLRRLIPEE